MSNDDSSVVDRKRRRIYWVGGWLNTWKNEDVFSFLQDKTTTRGRGEFAQSMESQRQLRSRHSGLFVGLIVEEESRGFSILPRLMASSSFVSRFDNSHFTQRCFET